MVHLQIAVTKAHASLKHLPVLVGTIALLVHLLVHPKKRKRQESSGLDRVVNELTQFGEKIVDLMSRMEDADREREERERREAERRDAFLLNALRILTGQQMEEPDNANQ